MADANPIRSYREKRNITVADLAKSIGVERSTVWRWDQGRAPDPKVWPAIIKATTITRQQLLRYAMAKKYAEAAE